jgi:cell division protein FtsA
MAKEELITGLDVGGSKVAAAVAVRGETGQPRIVGWATGRSEGMRRGIVVDMEAVIESVSKVLTEVQASAGSEIESVLVSVSGGHIQGRNSRGVVAVSRNGDEISARDVDRVIEAAGTMAIPHDREVLHVIKQEFTLDDQRGIRDPVGMSGIRLEAEVHLITGSVSSLKNLMKSIKMAGVEVDAMILDSLADSYSVIGEDEKEMGTALVNVGGDVTGLALFTGGSLRHSGVLLLGGEHVTNDVAIVQRMSVAEAEALKIREGCAVASENGKKPERGPQGSLFGRGGEDGFELCSVIRSRMEEIFELVKAEFENSPYFETIPAGIVLTGGGAKLGRLCELAETVFGRPTRIGRPRILEGMADKMVEPEFTTLVGLILCGCDTKAGRRYRRRNGSGVLGGVVEWLKVLKGDIW